jgi:hypothetical protein
VTDPKADPTEPLSINWLDQWDGHKETKAKLSWVSAELDKLIAAGLPPLTAIVTAPLSEQQNVALQALRAKQSVVYLRLHKTAVPPKADPYGRPLPLDKQGRVFVQKVRTNGAPWNASSSECAAWTGSARQAKNHPSNTHDPLYGTVTLTRDAVTAMPIDDAIGILRRWGFGVRASRREGKQPVLDREGKQVYGELGEPLFGRDTWLVLECDAQGRPLGYVEPEPKPAPQSQPQQQHHNQRGR